MNEMKAIRRRTSYFEDLWALAAYTAIEAEIEIRDGSETIYLFTSWNDLAPDETLFQATKESVFDLYGKVDSSSENEDELFAEIRRVEADKIVDDSKYAFFYSELKDMVNKELQIHGFDYDIDFNNDIMNSYEADGKRAEQTTVNNIRLIMKNFKCSLGEALDALEIKGKDRAIIAIQLRKSI